jgi:hypothetical protein
MNKNKTIEPSLLRHLSLGFMHDKITDTVVCYIYMYMYMYIVIHI